jgi:hypothetical protein
MEFVATLVGFNLLAPLADEKIIEHDYSVYLPYFPVYADRTNIKWNTVLLNFTQFNISEKIFESTETTYYHRGNKSIRFNVRDFITECSAKINIGKDSHIVTDNNDAYSIIFIWSDILAEAHRGSTSQTLERIIVKDSDNELARQSNLRKLNLGELTGITDEGIKNLTKLKEFHGGYNNFTDKAFLHLSSLCKLYLPNTDNITYQGLAHLKLEVLKIKRASHLAECEELKPILQYY